MATQIVMDHTGDTRHQFDQADAGRWRRPKSASRAHRRRLHRGKTAGEGKSEVLKTFDPTAEETLFIPRLKGG
jgi:hypothetical protein